MKYILLASILALFAWGCDGNGHDDTARSDAQPTTAPGAGPQVSIDNFSFAPQTITVSAGTRITWTNHDDVPHTVTSTTKTKILSSPTLDTDEKFSFVFTQSGVYEYYCAVHPHMTGKVIVK